MLGKAVALLTIWVVLAVVLVRVVVGPLWGSGTDLGLIAAPLVFALGAAGLIFLASRFVAIVTRPPNASNRAPKAH
jgi:hypothetical protein